MRRYESEVAGFDRDAEIGRIGSRLREYLRSPLNRRGLVVAISGGIDSSVCAALAVRSIGAARVFGLMLPETESSPESLEKGKLLAEHLGIGEAAVEARLHRARKRLRVAMAGSPAIEVPE